MRLYIKQDLGANRLIELTAAHAHYLRNVMRAGPGDKVSLFNGRDGEWDAVIKKLRKGSGSAVAQRQYIS